MTNTCCCVYSTRLLMMDRKPLDFYPKNKFEKLMHLVGFILRTESNVRCGMKY